MSHYLQEKLLFCQNLRLNIKKPIIDPIIIIRTESYISPEKNPINNKATIAEPAHNPLMPSIILKAFIIPTTQNIVKGILNIPN